MSEKTTGCRLEELIMENHRLADERDDAHRKRAQAERAEAQVIAQVREALGGYLSSSSIAEAVRSLRTDHDTLSEAYIKAQTQLGITERERDVLHTRALNAEAEHAKDHIALSGRSNPAAGNAPTPYTVTVREGNASLTLTMAGVAAILAELARTWPVKP